MEGRIVLEKGGFKGDQQLESMSQHSAVIPLNLQQTVTLLTTYNWIQFLFLYMEFWLIFK